MCSFAMRRNTLWAWALWFAFGILGFGSEPTTAQTSPVLFPVAKQLPLSGSAYPEFAGDFNGDGVPDLAYLGGVGLEIVLSAGSNTPTTVTTALTCPGASAVQAQPSFADVNNDKKLDLIYSCSGYITIQLGNGDGTFQTPAYFAINNAGTPVLVDLNGDGFLDIATLVSSSTAPQVAVLLNQGSTNPGVFQIPKPYPAPAGSSSLLAGDFNGDGKQDLITSILATSPNIVYTGFSILYGRGDGTLNASTTQSANFTGFTIGDFNNDGITDIALQLVPPSNTSLFTSVQVLLGSTSGTFSQSASLQVLAELPGATNLMEATDLTKSDNLDLVVASNVLDVFVGDGKGGFTHSGSYPVTSNGEYPLLFADLSGSGNPGLIFGNPYGAFYFPGNGDGTLQASPGTPVVGPVADVNNDGIADMVFTTSQTIGTSFGVALGRGDGTFSILDQAIPLPASDKYYLMTGDFNGDGNIDTIAINPGSVGDDVCVEPPNAQLISYLGSGNGRFQAVGTPVALGVSYPGAGVTGDFNSDGKLDLILPYGAGTVCGLGLVFVPGNGDGTFGTPVPLNVTQNNQYPGLLVGDLNNDKKLDFVWGNAVFLGNGDGTFRQIPLTVPVSTGQFPALVALSDLNGDGILDAVASPGTAIYAGNGDGTFQTTPFYTVPLPQYTYSFAAADVNGDSKPDLLFVEQGGGSSFLAVYVGDGSGNFTPDTNAYYVNASQYEYDENPPSPTRLNSQAPPLASDSKLDMLIPLGGSSGSTYAVSLLNQTNPPPVKPSPITTVTALQASPTTGTPGWTITFTASVFGTNPSGRVTFTANGNDLGTGALANGAATLQTSFASAGSYAVTASYPGDSNNSASTSAVVTVTIGQAATTTSLQASPSAGDVNGQITLTATVTGSVPTGTVTFATGTTSLGKATVSNGAATLQTSFAAAGSYPITATYGGDANNLSSTSSAVTVVIAAPGFTVAASPSSASVTAGQSATFTFTVTPSGGYSGTVKFSCGTLPSMAACAFSPASITTSGSAAASSTLTVTTAAATAMLHPDQPFGPYGPWLPVSGLALAGLTGLGFAPGRVKRWNSKLRLLSWALLLASVSLGALGCGGGNSTPSNPGTPAGSYTVSVTAGDSAGGPQQSTTVSLVVR